jgi:fibronectin-binding autotransporter adhesin
MKLLLRSIIFFAIASFAPLAFGDPDWTNQGPDNNFDNPANWINLAGVGAVPGPGDSMHIFPGFTVISASLLVIPDGSSTITINASGNESVQSFLVSSNFEGNTVPDGVLNFNFNGGSTLTVGVDGGVITGGSTVNYTGNLQMLSGALVVGTTASTIDPGETTGSGTFNLLSGTANISELDLGDTGSTGTFTQAGSTSSAVQIGFLNMVAGNYSISGTGTNNLTLSAGGIVDIGNATFSQNDSASTVDLSGGTTIEMGLTSGDNAIYNLQAGTLITTDTVLGFTSGSTGTLNQSGGILTSTGSFEIGDLGTGNYILSGGTADFQNGFTVEDSVGSTVTQSGSSILTAEGAVSIGVIGTGTYNLSGGSATFSDGLTVGATGQFNQSGGTVSLGTGASSLIVDAGGSVTQTGGTLTVNHTLGQTLDLSAVGSSYNLGGTGILQVGSGGLVGTTGEGRLNFAGGTLQITSTGTFTDPLDGTLTGTSTMDATTTAGITTVTMGGNLSGAGGITFEGSAGTTFHFAGTNTYTGATTIASGTLNASQADITHSSALIMGSTGVLNLTLASGGFAYAGALGGSGALNVNFNTAGDPFVVLNTSSYTGPITLGANGTRGTLQVYGGTFGNISDNSTASGVTVGGAPLAAFPGGTTVPSAGTVTFGNATYTGLTTINPGFTLNANTLSGPVTNSGTFYALGAGSVTNTGTLGLLQSSAVGSTFNVTGSLNSTGANTAFTIRVNGVTADSFVASTTATLSGVVNVTGSGSNTYTIVTAVGGITIGGDGLVNDAGGLIASTGSSVLFGATLLPDPFTGGTTTLQLTTTQRTFAQAIALGLLPGLTSNEVAVTGVLDPVIAGGTPFPSAFTSVLTAFNQLSASQIPGALEQLTPESLQYARNISFENSTFLAERMDGVCADLRGGYGGLDTNAISVISPGFNSDLGRSLGSLLAYNDPAFHQTAPNGVNYYPEGGNSTGGGGNNSSSTSTPTWDSSTQVISDSPNPYMATQNPSGPEAPGFSEFIGGDVILADLNQNQSGANAPSSKASYTAGDATAGVSFRMNSHLAAGVLFDYNHTDAKTDSSGSKTTVDSYSPGLFATFFDHGFYVNGLFSFGYNDYSNTRDISFLGQTASSHPNGQQYVGNLDLGYDFHPAKNWVVGPTVGVTYTHLDIDSFTETGAPGADLAVDSQSADSLRSRLGGHILFQTNTGDVLLQPNLTAMWQHEYLDDSSDITSSFNDFSSSPFTIQTGAPSRDSALIGCGLTATLSNSMALYLNYLADVGASNYFAQSVVGGFKARF